MDDQIKLVQMLKKNAPKIFVIYAAKKSNKLNGEIQDLRALYKYAKTDDEKATIMRKADKLKEELKLYQLP